MPNSLTTIMLDKYDSKLLSRLCQSIHSDGEANVNIDVEITKAFEKQSHPYPWTPICFFASRQHLDDLFNKRTAVKYRHLITKEAYLRYLELQSCQYNGVNWKFIDCEGNMDFENVEAFQTMLNAGVFLTSMLLDIPERIPIASDEELNKAFSYAGSEEGFIYEFTDSGQFDPDGLPIYIVDIMRIVFIWNDNIPSGYQVMRSESNPYLVINREKWLELHPEQSNEEQEPNATVDDPISREDGIEDP